MRKKKIINILTVARLVEFKGIEYSIRAIKILIDEGFKDIHYSIIGDGELYADLTRLAHNLKIEDFITFYRAQTQAFILDKYNNSDIFLLTGISSSDGRQENQGLVLQEAQSMELPVIASNIGGIPEGILNQQSGFLVNPKDAPDIADKIKNLFNAEMRTTMGKKGRLYVKEKFDSSIISDKLIELYFKVYNNSGKEYTSFGLNFSGVL